VQIERRKHQERAAVEIARLKADAEGEIEKEMLRLTALQRETIAEKAKLQAEREDYAKRAVGHGCPLTSTAVAIGVGFLGFAIFWFLRATPSDQESKQKVVETPQTSLAPQREGRAANVQVLAVQMREEPSVKEQLCNAEDVLTLQNLTPALKLRRESLIAELKKAQSGADRVLRGTLLKGLRTRNKFHPGPVKDAFACDPTKVDKSDSDLAPLSTWGDEKNMKLCARACKLEQANRLIQIEEKQKQLPAGIRRFASLCYCCGRYVDDSDPGCTCLLCLKYEGQCSCR
jgi:hypothetical protein